jgi:hypothetical protein
MSELSLLVKELNQCGETLISISKSLGEMFTDNKSNSSATTPTEKPEPAVNALSLEEVRAILADKSRAGHTAKIRELLQKYGAEKLSEIKPSDYSSLLAETEVL